MTVMKLRQIALALALLTIPFAVVVAQKDQIPLNSETSEGLPEGLPAPPLLGFGTWNLRVDSENTTNSVAHAIETGYRHIDCAAIYRNEKDVGKGIAKGLKNVKGLERKDIWITSKLWNDHHNPKDVQAGLDKTLSDLGLDYLDLYHMHWPVGSSPSSSESSTLEQFDYLSTWNSMTQLLSSNKVRHIGISNFSPHQLRTLLQESKTKPFLHQMELHPYLQQQEYIDWHKDNGILVTGYSPFGNMNPTYHKGSPRSIKYTATSPSTTTSSKSNNKNDNDEPPILLTKNPEMQALAKKLNATTAQTALAWGISRDTSVIPKSSHPQWIEENYQSLNVEFGREERKEIERIGGKYGPRRFNNPGDTWGVHLFEGLEDSPIKVGRKVEVKEKRNGEEMRKDEL